MVKASSTRWVMSDQQRALVTNMVDMDGEDIYEVLGVEFPVQISLGDTTKFRLLKIETRMLDTGDIYTDWFDEEGRTVLSNRREVKHEG